MNGAVTLEDSLAVSYIPKNSLTIQGAIEPHGIYPKELRTYLYTKADIKVFIVALFINAKRWMYVRFLR